MLVKRQWKTVSVDSFIENNNGYDYVYKEFDHYRCEFRTEISVIPKRIPLIKKAIQILWIFSCNGYVLVRL